MENISLKHYTSKANHMKMFRGWFIVSVES